MPGPPPPGGGRRHPRTRSVERPGAELLAGAHQLGRVRGAEPDRVDADVTLGCLLGGVDRIDAACVGAVGEQHDDVGDERSLRWRDRRRVRRRIVRTGRPGVGVDVRSDRGDVRVHSRDGIDGLQRGRADHRAARRREVVDGVGQLLLVRRGRHEQLREVGEGDEPMRVPATWSLTKSARCVLRRREAVGWHVGGAHGAGHIEGEDDRGAARAAPLARSAVGPWRRRARRWRPGRAPTGT